MEEYSRKEVRDFTIQIAAEMPSITKKRKKRESQDENEPPHDPLSKGKLYVRNLRKRSGIEDHLEGLQQDNDVQSVNWRLKSEEVFQSDLEFSLDSDSEDNSLPADPVVAETPSATDLYFCPCCPLSFPAEDDYKQHLATHNLKVDTVIFGSLEPHKCKICGAGFELHRELIKHALSHIIKTPFGCPTCLKQFTRQAYLAQHEELHYDNDCHDGKVCEKRVLNQSQPKGNSLSGIVAKRFSCWVCRKQFTRETWFKKHSEKVCEKRVLNQYQPKENSLSGIVEKRFSCQICQKQFIREMWFKKHEKLHVDVDSDEVSIVEVSIASQPMNRKPVNPSARFECRACYKMFLHSVTLKEHMLKGRCMREACV